MSVQRREPEVARRLVIRGPRSRRDRALRPVELGPATQLPARPNRTRRAGPAAQKPLSSDCASMPRAVRPLSDADTHPVNQGQLRPVANRGILLVRLSTVSKCSSKWPKNLNCWTSGMSAATPGSSSESHWSPLSRPPFRSFVKSIYGVRSKAGAILATTVPSGAGRPRR